MLSGGVPDFSLEDGYGGCLVAGVDEAGRGPWAGPVVAGAVILDRASVPEGLNDSKKLSRPKRAVLFEAIRETASVGVGLASVEEIDEINILQASLLAMSRALAQLDCLPGAVLVDGNHAPRCDHPVQCVIKGDGLSLSVAAASIIAKVTRDRIMEGLAETYPTYGWERNAGYGTREHRQALSLVGITPHHRKSFAPIREILSQDTLLTS